MSEFFLIVGPGRCGLGRLNHTFKKSKGYRIINPSPVHWNRDDSTLNYLANVVDQLNKNRFKEKGVGIISSALLPHIEYLQNNFNGSVKTVFVHRYKEDFVQSFLKLFGFRNPFVENLESKLFLGDARLYYPNYELDNSKSFRYYVEKYWDYYEDKMNRISSKHDLELYYDELVRNRSYVTVKISRFTSGSNETFIGLDEIGDDYVNVQKKYLFSREDHLSEFSEGMDAHRISEAESDISATQVETNRNSLLITTFLRPTEVEMFEKQSDQLIRSLLNINGSQRKVDFSIRVHLDLSDFYVNWSKSKASKSEVLARFEIIKSNLSDYFNVEFTHTGKIHGCNDLRRSVIERGIIHDYDAISYLDPDILFSESLLTRYNMYFPKLIENYTYFGLSNYVLNAKNKYFDSINVSDSISNKPNFKLIESYNEDIAYLEKTEKFRMSGLFTIVSSKFLDLTGIPPELGYYGNDDRYITECIKIFNQTSSKNHVHTFNLKNSVVYQLSEDYKNKFNLYEMFLTDSERSNKKNLAHHKSENNLDVLFERFRKKIKNGLW